MFYVDKNHSMYGGNTRVHLFETITNVFAGKALKRVLQWGSAAVDTVAATVDRGGSPTSLTLGNNLFIFSVADTGGVGNTRDDLPIILDNISGTSYRGYNWRFQIDNFSFTLLQVDSCIRRKTFVGFRLRFAIFPSLWLPFTVLSSLIYYSQLTIRDSRFFFPPLCFIDEIGRFQNTKESYNVKLSEERGR